MVTCMEKKVEKEIVPKEIIKKVTLSFKSESEFDKNIELLSCIFQCDPPQYGCSCINYCNAY